MCASMNAWTRAIRSLDFVLYSTSIAHSPSEAVRAQGPPRRHCTIPDGTVALACHAVHRGPAARRDGRDGAGPAARHRLVHARDVPSLRAAFFRPHVYRTGRLFGRREGGRVGESPVVGAVDQLVPAGTCR